MWRNMWWIKVLCHCPLEKWGQFSSSPESGLGLCLLSPIQYGRSDNMPIPGLTFKRTSSFHFLPFETQFPCYEEAQAASWRGPQEGELKLAGAPVGLAADSQKQSVCCVSELSWKSLLLSWAAPIKPCQNCKTVSKFFKNYCYYTTKLQSLKQHGISTKTNTQITGRGQKAQK